MTRDVDVEELPDGVVRRVGQLVMERDALRLAMFQTREILSRTLDDMRSGGGRGEPVMHGRQQWHDDLRRSIKILDEALGGEG